MSYEPVSSLRDDVLGWDAVDDWAGTIILKVNRDLILPALFVYGLLVVCYLLLVGAYILIAGEGLEAVPGYAIMGVIAFYLIMSTVILLMLCVNMLDHPGIYPLNYPEDSYGGRQSDWLRLAPFPRSHLFWKMERFIASVSLKAATPFLALAGISFLVGDLVITFVSLFLPAVGLGVCSAPAAFSAFRRYREPNRRRWKA